MAFPLIFRPFFSPCFICSKLCNQYIDSEHVHLSFDKASFTFVKSGCLLCWYFSSGDIVVAFFFFIVSGFSLYSPEVPPRMNVPFVLAFLWEKSGEGEKNKGIKNTEYFIVMQMNYKCSVYADRNHQQTSIEKPLWVHTRRPKKSVLSFQAGKGNNGRRVSIFQTTYWEEFFYPKILVSMLRRKKLN